MVLIFRLSARIRGATTELEDLGEEEDEFTKTTSKLRDLVKGLTGFDIMKDENTFKDIYDIILGIGKEWKNLTDIEQASLGEALAGKRNANALYAVLNNLDMLEDAYKTASDAAGSAEKEQENYAKSIQYSLDRLTASWQELQVNILDSSFAKKVVDLGNKIVNVLDEIFKHPLLTDGLIALILGGVVGKKTDFGTKVFESLYNIGNKGLSQLSKGIDDYNNKSKNKEIKQETGLVVANTKALEAQSIAREQDIVATEQQALSEEGIITAKEAVISATGEEILAATSNIAAKNGVSLADQELINAEIRAAIAEEEEAGGANLSSIALMENAAAHLRNAAVTGTDTDAIKLNAAALLEQEAASRKAASGSNMLASTLKGAAAMVLISLAIKGLSTIIDKIIVTKKELKELSEQAVENIDKIQGELKDHSELVEKTEERYIELSKQVGNLGSALQNQGGLNDEEYKEFLDISNQLAEAFPSTTKGITDTGDAIIYLGNSADSIHGSLRQLIQDEEDLANIQIRKNLADQWKAFGYDDNIFTNVSEKYSDWFNTSWEQILEGFNSKRNIDINLSEVFGKDERDALEKAFENIGLDFSDYYNAGGVFTISKLSEEQIEALKVELSKINEDFNLTYATYIRNIEDGYKEQNDILLRYLSSEYNEDFQPIASAIVSNLNMEDIMNNLPDYVDKNNLAEIAEYIKSEYLSSVNNAFSEYEDDPIVQEWFQTVLDPTASNQDVYDALINLYETLGADAGNNLMDAFGSRLEESAANMDQVYQRYFKWIEDKIHPVDEEGNIGLDLSASIEYAQDIEDIYDFLRTLSPEDLAVLGNADALNLENVDALKKYLEEIYKTKAIIEQEANRVPSTITDAVTTFNTKLKPQFDELANAYNQIFNNSDGFKAGLESIDIAWFAGLQDQFTDLKETLGEDFDASNIEEFFAAIENGGEITEEVAHQAFNDLATAYFYAADGLADLNDETAESIKQMMEQMGVINAEEIVNFYNTLNDSKIELRGVFDELKEAGLEIESLNEYMLNTSAEEIQALQEEGRISETTAQQIMYLALQKQTVTDHRIQTASDIDNLIELARGAGIAEKQIELLIQARDLYNSGELSTKKDIGLIQSSVNDLVKQFTAETSIEIDFQTKDTSSGGGGGAGDAGKDAADEYVDAFNEELQNLEWLKDNNFISEKEFLDQYRLLYQKYFSDLDKYGKEFYENQQKYLEQLKSYYESVLSAITSLLDDEIDKYEKLKDKETEVFNKEKEQNNKKIKAIQKEIKEIDKVIKKLEKEKDAIQKNDIDPLQAQIDARQEIISDIQKEIDLMERANQERQKELDLQLAKYNLERMTHQRTQLVFYMPETIVI